MTKVTNRLEMPKHECHVISRSEYTDQKIATTLRLPTPLGLPFEIWLNANGNVIGCNYYREEEQTKGNDGK